MQRRHQNRTLFRWSMNRKATGTNPGNGSSSSSSSLSLSISSVTGSVPVRLESCLVASVGSSSAVSGTSDDRWCSSLTALASSSAMSTHYIRYHIFKTLDVEIHCSRFYIITLIFNSNSPFQTIGISCCSVLKSIKRVSPNTKLESMIYQTILNFLWCLEIFTLTDTTWNPVQRELLPHFK